MSWANYKDKVRKYFPFSKTEWNNFIILVLVFALILFLFKWGTKDMELAEWIKNALISILSVAIAVFAHHSAQRLYGIFFGYRIEHRIWWAGLLSGVLAIILTRGKVPVLAGSAIQPHFLAVHRLGAWRYGPSMWQIGLVAFSGPVASVLVAVLLWLASPTFFSPLLTFSLIFAFYCILPVPPLDGVHVFAASRIYGFVFIYAIFSILAFLVLYFIAGISMLWSLGLALIIGFLCWLAYDAVMG